TECVFKKRGAFCHTENNRVGLRDRALRAQLISTSNLKSSATEHSILLRDTFNSCGMDATTAMAGNDRDPALLVAGRGAIENKTAMGLLAFPDQQRALGCVGLEGERLCVGHSPVRPRRAEPPRRREEQARLKFFFCSSQRHLAETAHNCRASVSDAS